LSSETEKIQYYLMSKSEPLNP